MSLKKLLFCLIFLIILSSFSYAATLIKPRQIDRNWTGYNLTLDYLTAKFLDGNLSWDDLYNYPSACPSGTAITKLGDTITCTAVGDQWDYNITTLSNNTDGKLDINASYWENLYVKLANLVGMVGNWSKDKPSYDNQTETNKKYLNLSGTNANQNIDISSYNFTAKNVITSFVGEFKHLFNLTKMNITWSATPNYNSKWYVENNFMWNNETNAPNVGSKGNFTVNGSLLVVGGGDFHGNFNYNGSHTLLNGTNLRIGNVTNFYSLADFLLDTTGSGGASKSGKSPWLHNDSDDIIFNETYGNLKYKNETFIATVKVSNSSYSDDSNLLDGKDSGYYSHSYYFNKTTNTYDGNDLGNYSEARDKCNNEFAGSHICTVNEILDTMMYKNASTLPEWSGTVWIIGGPPGYTADANDCLGWTSDDSLDYGRFWNFDEATTNDGMGWLTSCSQSKSLACCKAD